MLGKARMTAILTLVALSGLMLVSSVAAGVGAEGQARTPRMVNDVPIPICEDIGWGGPEKVHVSPSGPPVLWGEGANVVCGALPTVVQGAHTRPVPIPTLAEGEEVSP
ncbi:MAG: hypothetical protein Q8O40_06230 [Chloroflexota bacterium]|nr:hypothetical protein [Chloroflexota bacterium]